MKELQVIDISRKARVRKITPMTRRKKLAKRLKHFWREWGITFREFLGLIAAAGIMIGLPYVLCIITAVQW